MRKAVCPTQLKHTQFYKICKVRHKFKWNWGKLRETLYNAFMRKVKKVSNHKKGMSFEKEVAKYFQDSGWLTVRPNWSQWGYKDFWGLFDIIAIKGYKVLLIQVKVNKSDSYSAVIKIKEWKIANFINLDCEVIYRQETQAIEPLEIKDRIVRVPC